MQVCSPLKSGSPCRLLAFAVALALVLAGSDFARAEPLPAECSDCARPRMSGSWGGHRDRIEARGLRVDLDATYTFQGVASGGLDSRVAALLTAEDDLGNTFSSDLILELDSERAGLWRGGLLRVRVEGRAGESAIERAGTVSPVGNEPIYPNVVDDFDGEVIAFTELTLFQSIGRGFGVFGGLMNTAEGDANTLAGSAISNEHFLNSALLYSLVEDATVANSALGGGISYEPSERLVGSVSAFGTSETAGTDPFSGWQGTTFSTEWTFAHALGERPGAQTLGFLYGIDASRTDIARSPRVAIGSILLGLPVPSTDADTWSLYYNAEQFVHGDAERGVGVFLRLGFSDGNPNPIRWNLAAGLGGTGIVPGRPSDRFGAGFFYLGVSDADLLRGLGVGDEVGGELFYDFALTGWLRITADAQVVDPARPVSGTAVVLALRTRAVF